MSNRGRDKMFDEVWEAFIDACGGGCVQCGRTDVHLDKGHIIPYRDGGSDQFFNRQPLCAWCNNSESYNNPMRDYRPKNWRECFIRCLAKKLEEPRPCLAD
jgi:HNH endonuclease